MPAGISAWTPLANLTLATSAASVTFSSINQSYRDLALITSTTSASGIQLVYLVFNGNGSGYSYCYGEGTGSSAVGGSAISQGLLYLDPGANGATTAGNFYTAETHIMDYAQTNKHKQVLSRVAIPIGAAALNAGRWANTSAITSISVNAGSNNFVAGSTFALYGVS